MIFSPRTTRAIALTRLACTLLLGCLLATATQAMAADEPRGPAANPDHILLQAAQFDPRDGSPQLPPELSAEEDDGPDYFIVQYRQPVERRHRQRVEALGGSIIAYVPMRALLLKLTPPAATALRADADVRWVGLYQPAYRLSPQAGRRQFSNPHRLADDHLWLTLDIFPGEDLRTVAADLHALGAEVVARSESPFARRLKIRAAPRLLPELAHIRAVQWIEEWGEFTLRNNDTRWVVQSNVAGLTSIWNHGLHGEGQIVGHIDSRIKHDSCYFEDPFNNTPGPDHRKLVAYRSTGGLGQGSHGTHTAGIIAGDQEPLGGTIDGNGIAYRARISHTDWNDITGFGNTASNLAEYLTYAHDDGARVHTNSWGDDGTTEYTTWARDIDQFSRLHEDDLVGFAVTNLSALKTPENAKNVLAIGATYQAPNQHQHSSGGQGPTADGRRKPELYAPGRYIYSAQLAVCATTSQSGTSMACPAIMGAAALVRQYYVEGWYPTGNLNPGDAMVPTGALLKATLLNAGVDMEPPGYPTFTEGWGRLLLENSLYFDGDSRNLQLWDVRHADGLETGEVLEFAFETISDDEPLRVTLVFTDEPAVLGATYTPVNDLDLEVVSPTTTYRGNMLSDGWSVPGGDADPLNNVEMVLLENPGVTSYQVRVIGTQIAGSEPQGFAIVVTGDLSRTAAAVGEADAITRAPAGRLAVQPNPFNPETTIDFSLPHAGLTSLAVYDPAGHRLRTLVEGLRQPGVHRVRWDGRDERGHLAASGIYLLRLEQDGRELGTRKAILLK